MGKVSKALNKLESIEPGSSAPLPRSQKIARSSDVKKHKSVTDISAQLPPIKGVSKNWDERLLHVTQNFLGVVESFRKLRTMILHPDIGAPARSIMVLSSEPQEGKSFVCANLGISFAHSVEKQSLMIDCDLRRPSLHKLFGVKGHTGLAGFLQNGGSVSKLIAETGLPRLSLIPSGAPPNNPAELLSSEKMHDIFTELIERSTNQLLILDTPPHRAASETLVLSQLVDKVVLVVRWGKSGRESIVKMINTIGREKIVGVVFNGFEMNFLDRKAQGFGYHNYYSETETY